jgi:energy-coupling factor transporter ATP-binding protein EcfA2
MSRLAAIKICGCRGFLHPVTIWLSSHDEKGKLTGAGKNLVLYGQNGSGKSSLFRAIQEFFRLDDKGKPFAAHKNIFSDRLAGRTVTEGHITVHFTDGSSHRWPNGADRPVAATGSPVLLQEAARRKGLLDYRALLQTNFIHRTGRVNVFDLVVKELLSEMTVTQPGGTSTTLGKLWKAVEDAHLPKLYHYRRRLRHADYTRNAFNTAFAGVLPDLQQKTNEMLNRLLAPGVTVGLDFPRVGYNPTGRHFTGGQLLLEATLYGETILEHQHFLNEARLSAIGLAIYFASLLVSIPAPVPGALAYPGLLVLDDVLIGLDMSNRLPVLKLVREVFAEWQVLLMTHDRVWFDLIRGDTEQTGEWKYMRLRELQTTLRQPTQPVIEPSYSALRQAEFHLNAGELVAAAIHIRSGVEARLRNVCRDSGIEIPYKPDPREVKADKLWEGIVRRQQARQAAGQRDFVDPRLMNDVETIRSTILNQLSHAGPPTLVLAEVQFALDTVKKLDQYQFTKTP